MIDIQNIDYSIKSKQLISQITFSARQGEFIAILGPNGAGKSTLLRVLTGEIKQSRGAVRLGERTLSDYSTNELARTRAVLEQHSPISMPFTVREIVLMGRYPHRKSSAVSLDLNIANACMRKTGIEHLAHRIFNTLSGGEKQRVQLARVFAQISGCEKETCKCLFLDEPVNSLDVKFQHSTLQLASDFRKKGNVVIAVLHDINLAARYADKILLMKNGQQLAFGNLDEILTSKILSKCYEFDVQVQENPFDTKPHVYFGDSEKNNQNQTILDQTDQGINTFVSKLKKSREEAVNPGI